MATKPKKRTTDKIKSTLIKMLEKSPLEDISVTSLCSAAKVNRATFYYHYDSVTSVFNEMETHIEQDFAQSLARAAVSGVGMPEKSFYVMFFEFVARNASVCRLILNAPHGNNNSFLTRALESGRDKVTGMMTKLHPDCSAHKIDVYYIYVSNGFLGLLGYWLNNGMKESVEEIAGMGERLACLGEKFLDD